LNSSRLSVDILRFLDGLSPRWICPTRFNLFCLFSLNLMMRMMYQCNMTELRRSQRGYFQLPPSFWGFENCRCSATFWGVPPFCQKVAQLSVLLKYHNSLLSLLFCCCFNCRILIHACSAVHGRGAMHWA